MKEFEPQKFFIGVIDLFSVLLPGALLTYLLMGALGPLVLGTEAYRALGGAQGWLVFFFSSYLLGHFVFLLGAALLDDYVYDPIRKGTDWHQVERLARGKPLSSRFVRWLARCAVREDADPAVRRAGAIKEHYLDPLAARDALNAFQWCKARLALEAPEAFAAVQRFEADSKFFRSLVVVLFILFWATIPRPALALLVLLLLVLALWRYLDQRVKATTQAYWYVITMEAREGGFRQPATPADGPTHAGGVVFRHREGRPEYLLVHASQAPDELVLPKGHIEVGESRRQAAVREVREESGVWARVEAKLGTMDIVVHGAPISIRFFLMEALEEKAPGEEQRKPEWLGPDQVLDRATHKETRKLLRQAEERRQEIYRLPERLQPHSSMTAEEED